MIPRIKKYWLEHQEWGMPLVFCLMALIGVIYLAFFHEIYYNSDYLYHFNQIRSIFYSVIRLHFPLLNQGTAVPYGTVTDFYPWLMILPLVLVYSVIRDPVVFFYVAIGLITLATYFTSYYSIQAFDRKLSDDFVFALFYTNSSILFDWAFRAGNFGVLLAMAGLPLAFFGLLNFMRHRRSWWMMTIGMIWMFTSNVLVGLMATLTFFLLCLLDFKRFYHNWKWLSLSLIAILVLTSFFWYPVLKLSLANRIVMPPYSYQISSGLVPWIGAFCNYVYGLPELIGLLSLREVYSAKFSRLDLGMWLISFFCILVNVRWIADLLTQKMPWLRQIQGAFRFSLIAHLLLTYLAVKWLTGHFNDQRHHVLRTPILILVILIWFVPLNNEIGTQFLLHKRPLMTARNLGDRNKPDPYKMNAASIKRNQHHYFNYDYAPNAKVIKYLPFDNHYRACVYDAQNHRLAYQIKYRPTSTGIWLKNDHSSSLQVPFLIYHGIRYRFLINGRRLSKRHINQTLTRRTHELVIHNVPPGKLFISLSSAALK